MALIPCRECKEEISDEAKACPCCGAPAAKKTGYLWLFILGMGALGALAVALVAIRTFSGNNQAKVDPTYEKKAVYTIKAKENRSSEGRGRMVYRAIFHGNSTTDEALETTSGFIWNRYGKYFSEFTVLGYLPDMNTNDLAYSVAEFTPRGLVSFKVNPEALTLSRLR